MLCLATAVERAMKRQEVILRALSGALSWLQAADILGIDPRSLRRWRARYEADQMIGLYDRRQLPSPRKAPVAEVQRVLRLYRDTYRGFNVRHFHHLIRRLGTRNALSPSPPLPRPPDPGRVCSRCHSWPVAFQYSSS